MKPNHTMNDIEPIIKTDEENRVALLLVERLMDGDPERDTKEGQLLCLLAEAIQVYEKKYDNSALRTAATAQEKEPTPHPCSDPTLQHDCSGCTDPHSEGTHQGCTKQHGHIGCDRAQEKQTELPNNQPHHE